MERIRAAPDARHGPDRLPMTPTLITICDTCKREGWDPETDDRTDGVRFAEKIEGQAEGLGSVQTRRHSCLMGCTHGCNVAIQAAGKLSYVLGRFEPTDEAAEGIVEYARLHAESESGQVPFRSWPSAVRGHFVSRIPPAPGTGSPFS